MNEDIAWVVVVSYPNGAHTCYGTFPSYEEAKEFGATKTQSDGDPFVALRMFDPSTAPHQI